MTGSSRLPLEIRPAAPSDAPALTDIAHRAKSHWGYPGEWMEFWNEELTLTSEYLSVHPGFVALEAGRPVGVCMLELQDDDATLEHVWIDPDYQRHGLGRALVSRALTSAAAAGVSRVKVVSDPFAEPFYCRLGARRIGLVPAPMPGALDRVLPVLEFATGHERQEPNGP